MTRVSLPDPSLLKLVKALGLQLLLKVTDSLLGGRGWAGNDPKSDSPDSQELVLKCIKGMATLFTEQCRQLYIFSVYRLKCSTNHGAWGFGRRTDCSPQISTPPAQETEVGQDE